MLTINNYCIQHLGLKRYFLGILAIGFLMIHQSEASAFNPPPEVIRAFTQHYPGAKSTRWTKLKEEDRAYKATFTQNKVKLYAYFSKEGKWMETEKHIRIKELPEPVKKTLDSQYGEVGYIKLKAMEIWQNDGALVYAVTVFSNGKRSDLVVTLEGSFIYR